MQHTDTCDDCVVSFLSTANLTMPWSSMQKARADRMLEDAGLVPSLLFCDRAS